jgi:hypothetical protein
MRNTRSPHKSEQRRPLFSKTFALTPMLAPERMLAPPMSIVQPIVRAARPQATSPRRLRRRPPATNFYVLFQGLASRRNWRPRITLKRSNPGWDFLHWHQKALTLVPESFRAFRLGLAERAFPMEECRDRVPFGRPSRMRKIRSALLQAKGYLTCLLPYRLHRMPARPVDAIVAQRPAKTRTNFSGGTT